MITRATIFDIFHLFKTLFLTLSRAPTAPSPGNCHTIFYLEVKWTDLVETPKTYFWLIIIRTSCLLTKQNRRLRGAYRIGSCLSVVVVCRQRFQTTSPLRPLGQLSPTAICGILWQGNWKLVCVCVCVFLKTVILVWLLWQLRLSIDL